MVGPTVDLIEAADLDIRHPWEQARSRFFLDVLREAGALDRGGRVLDVGAGDAWFAQQLKPVLPVESDIACWDRFYRDEDIVSLSNAGIVASREPPSGRFDLLLLLDVLEHVEDDVTFLRDLIGRLQPGATALISVPAWPRLFSKHDEALKHFRRYTPDACRRVIADAGLTITMSGGVFHGLLAPRAVGVVWERLRKTNTQPANLGAWKGGALVTRAIAGALHAEARLSLELARRGIDVPGLSFWALCHLSKQRWT